MKKILFSGSRDWTDRDVVKADVAALPDDTHVIVGDCPTGVDKMVFDAAAKRGLAVTVFRADWHTYGRAAGPMRNNKMIAERPDRAYFYVTPKSRGTRQCLSEARRVGISDIVVTEDMAVL